MNQARSRAIDRIRFEQRKKRVLPPSESASSATVDQADREVLLGQQGRALRLAMSSLTAPEREAIELAFFGDCTYSEVAERLNEPPGTIKTRIRSGLTKLRLAVGKEEGLS